MYAVFKNNKLIAEGTLSECIEFVATAISDIPEQVTLVQAIAAGYQLTRI